MRGIYGFRNKRTNKWYIGQSINVEARFIQHLKDTLERNKELVKFHKALAEDPFDANNWEYRVFENDINATDEQLDLWEASYIDLYNSCADGYNSTKGNHAERIHQIIKSAMHTVSQEASKHIWKFYKLNILEEKNVLIIGQWRLADNLIMNNNGVTVITDNLGYSEDGAKLYRVNGTGELMAEIEKLAGKHFDLVIANPPYAIGNQVVRSIIENIDFDTFINLMPASKYKGGELYKHVAEVHSVEDTFEDATVGASLTVAVLKKEDAGRFNSFDEFENEKRDPRFREFYRLNATKESHKLDYAYANKFYDGCDTAAFMEAKADLLDWWSMHDTKFCVTWRAVQNGTHSTDGNAFDVSWNIKKTIDENALPIAQSKKRQNTSITVDFIDFSSPVECANFTRFFYAGGKAGLMNNLVKGLNKSSGSIAAAIPNIDWSIERDYEHLTLEDIMTILREEA